MKAENIPNLLTVLRFAIIIPILFSLIHEAYYTAFALFGLAGISDLFDGFLARRYGWTSRFGSISDPLADKALLAACFVALSMIGVVPVSVTCLVVFRDLWIIAGAAVFHFAIGTFSFKPSFISKCNTGVQLLFIAGCLFNLVFPLFPEAWLYFLQVIVVVTTVITLLHYTWVWGKKAYGDQRQAI